MKLNYTKLNAVLSTSREMSFAAAPEPNDSPSLSERTGLLGRDTREEDTGTAYASDGETPVFISCWHKLNAAGKERLKKREIHFI